MVSYIIAKPFDEIQARVADLLKGRILVGHAVHNDLKVCTYLPIRTSALDLLLLCRSCSFLTLEPSNAIRNISRTKTGSHVARIRPCATSCGTCFPCRFKAGSIARYVIFRNLSVDVAVVLSLSRSPMHARQWPCSGCTENSGNGRIRQCLYV